MLIDNSEKLKKILTFSDGSYYKFVVLLRKKDKELYPVYDKFKMEKGEIIVKQWLIGDEEHFDKVLPEMLYVTELFQGRLYMGLDRKNIAKTMITMRDKLNEHLNHLIFNNNSPVSTRMLNKLLASATSQSEASDDKYWLFDVDVKDESVLNEVIDFCGEHYVETFETKNGYHVIAKRRFNGNLFSSDTAECKSNSLVLIAMK